VLTLCQLQFILEKKFSKILGMEKVMVNKRKSASDSTLRRLPLYLYYLKSIAHENLKTISCTRISREFGFDPTQVRKDIAETGIVGIAKIGYKTGELIKKIESFLGWNKLNEAFLVGVGGLGKTLLGYRNFKTENGLDIVAGFDNDESKVGSYICHRRIFHITKLPELSKRMNIRIGIIAVPEKRAQEIAEIMVEAGIKGIWNFSLFPLKVPEDVIVENARLSTSLAVLTSRLNARPKPN